jgi:beta-glucosidase
MIGWIDSHKNYLTGLFAILLVGVMVSVVSCARGGGELEPYKNAELPVEERVEDLLSRMTLEEKIDQLGGVGFDTKENKRLGMPTLRMCDGPVGVRWEQATAFPAAIGLAASWDNDLVRRVAGAIAKETKAKGRNYLLGPCVNIHRHPLGGRNFESYGEDPYLAGRLAVSFVKGIQQQNVLASVKHFAVNNQEWERYNLDVMIDERPLREIYLPAFKAAVQEGGAWTVMAAYNVLRGDHCSEQAHLLNDILKGEWGFKGFVVSDWGSVYSSAKAAHNGLDLEMPYGKFFGEKLLADVKNGDVAETVIDEKIRRLMRARFEVGLFDETGEPDPSVLDCKEHRALALEAAQKSIVLMKNDGQLLPLDLANGKVKSIAVLGPNAAHARVGGGGSSKVTPFYKVSPLEAIRERVGDDVAIHYAYGINIKDDVHPMAAPFKGEYFSGLDLKGEPVMVKDNPEVNFNWGYSAPHPSLHRENDRNLFSVRWTGTLSPPEDGDYTFEAVHNDGFRVFIGDKPVIDDWNQGPTRRQEGTVALKKGQAYDIRVEYFFDGGISEVTLGWKVPGFDPIAEAVALAKQSDVAIVFAGLSERFESESYDRPRMDLPNQAKLIQAVAKANPNTVVVLQMGGLVLMEDWDGIVPAVMAAWYGGQECGNAIAHALFGDVNPGGKLPFSFIRSKEDTPAFEGYMDPGKKSYYKEGIFVGYRYLDREKKAPRYPFGHGLSYTSFGYDNLKIEGNGDNGFTITFNVKNTGDVTGTEVAQLYIHDPECSVPRPLKELKRFKKIALESGEKGTVTMELLREDLAYFSEDTNGWVTEAGEYEVWIGSSSTDIRLKGKLSVPANPSL